MSIAICQRLYELSPRASLGYCTRLFVHIYYQVLGFSLKTMRWRWIMYVDEECCAWLILSFLILETFFATFSCPRWFFSRADYATMSVESNHRDSSDNNRNFFFFHQISAGDVLRNVFVVDCRSQGIDSSSQYHVIKRPQVSDGFLWNYADRKNSRTLLTRH